MSHRWSTKGERRKVQFEVGFKHGLLTIVKLCEFKSWIYVDCDCGRKSVLLKTNVLRRLDVNTSCGSLCKIRPDPIPPEYQREMRP